MNHKFTDIYFVTNNVLRLRTFYEFVFGVKAEGDEWHSTMNAGGLGIVFLLEKNSDFYFEFVNCGSNTGLSFNVDDTDAEYQRLLSLGIEPHNKPTTYPCGAWSFQLKDPNGNILNFRNMPDGTDSYPKNAANALK